MRHVLFIAVVLLTARFCVSQSAYTGTDIVQPPATPNLGVLTKNNSIVTDASFPLINQARVARCTDAVFAPDAILQNQNYSAGLGGSGDAVQLFNADSTLLHVNGLSGRGLITRFDPSTMVCAGAITRNLNLTNPGSASNAFNFGDGSFSWTDPTIYYSFGTNTDTGGTTKLSQYTINTSTGTFTGPVTITDLANALPSGSLVSTWQSSHAYASGTYIKYTLTSGEAPDWSSGHSYTTLGDIILPLTNNPLGCAFKLTVVGTSAGSSPTWSSGSACPAASSSQVTDGVARWRSIGTGTFIYQLTSTGGNSGSSTPAFVPAGTGHPDLMTTVSDNGLTWTNVGPMVNPAWASFAGVSEDSTRVCAGLSTNQYGYAGNYTTWNGAQDTGIYAACFDSAANAYHLLNTATGFQSSVSGGVMTPDGQATALTGCGFFVHNDKGTSGADYQTITPKDPMATNSCGSVTPIVWKPFAAWNNTTAVKFYLHNLNHYATGASHSISVTNPSFIYGANSGAYAINYDLTDPGNALTPINWQVIPCSNPFVAGVDPSACAFNDDSHLAWAYNPSNRDITPVCGTVFNINNLSPVAEAAWQGEEVCISTSPTWTDTATPNALQKQWRFTHTFSTGTGPGFDHQFQISQMSHDGRFMAWSSDWMCGLGTATGTTTPLCGLQWQPLTTYTNGTMLHPFSSNTGSGTDFGVWQVTTGGTTTSTKPAWVVCSSGNVGATVSRDGLVYTCMGASDERGDVFVVSLNLPALRPVTSHRIRTIQ